MKCVQHTDDMYLFPSSSRSICNGGNKLKCQLILVFLLHNISNERKAVKKNYVEH